MLASTHLHPRSTPVAIPVAISARLALLTLVAFGPVGCDSGPAVVPSRASGDAATRPMPGRLQHVVLVELLDKGDLAQMLADSDRLLPQIPTVRGYVAGTPVDIGRGNVAKDYDIGLVVQFDDEAGYRAYLAHPLHEQLAQKWRPRWRRAYIVDFAP